MNSGQNSPQPIFQFDSAVGFLVTIFHDDWSVKGEAPFVGCTLFHLARASLARAHCTRAGHDYGIFGNFEWSVERCTVDFAAHQVVKRRGPRQNCPRTEDGPRAPPATLLHSPTAPHHP